MATKLNFCPFRNLPEKGTPGHLYFVKDTPTGPELLLASREGILCPVTEFFNLQIAEAPGMPGRDGKDGRDGADGKDGQPGPKGDRGDIAVIGNAELQAAVAKLKAQKAAVLARIIQKLDAVGNHPAYRIAKAHLEDVKKELEAQ